ncbi:MAG: hypothetical protein ACRDPC_27520, partial [Solirubrobacteraceae bacterium]
MHLRIVVPRVRGRTGRRELVDRAEQSAGGGRRRAGVDRFTESPRLVPRQAPDGWHAAGDQAGEVAQRRGRSAGRVRDEHEP